MPGGDRTGPNGQGPMTGRAAGYCAGYAVGDYAGPVFGRGGFGYGRGFARGRGRGRGFGWRRPDFSYDYSQNYPVKRAISPNDEATFLRQEAKALQEEITLISQRIKDLETASSDQGNE